jgi:hypothetical protein
MKRRILVAVVVTLATIVTFQAYRLHLHQVTIFDYSCHLLLMIIGVTLPPPKTCFAGIATAGSTLGIGASLDCVGDCANVTLGNTTIFLCDPISVKHYFEHTLSLVVI